MIELRGVHFAYNERPILRNVSFRVEDSESVVILGPSGSGKSTILRLILGLECPQEGEVIVDHRDICHLDIRTKRQIRKKIGMVFQDGALFDSLNVAENVGYYLLEHTNASLEEIDARVREILGFVGLKPDEIVDVLPEQLSGGMQRRVAIARALLSTDPQIMLYDEPTTGLDPQATSKVLALIQKLQSERSISSIVVTHQIADAVSLSRRFIVIVDGAVAFDGSLRELRDCPDPRVQSFLGPFKESFDEVVRQEFMRY
ncbi:ATP-binding cassette domain-containing protein [candidate division GN15 bacterium]|nr:ATP-binding cassette domain-containing protein [candidate division GN15 bacterium]